MHTDGKIIMFENRLAKVFKHKSKLARRQNVTCYRVYDHDLPEFPFSIEMYENKVYVAEYLRRHGMDEEEHEEWMKECIQVISKILKIEEDFIFIRQRKKMSHRKSGAQYEKLDSESHAFIVQENGLKFKVNLTDYLDTGLFLDHRITRKMVMEESENKDVLNLFCYTASFSVYAMAGKANSVTSVDLSKTYLSWGEENFKLNNFRDKQKAIFVHADVKQYLKTLKPESFDLIVMDPPTFSNSKRMKDFLEIQTDHTELINDCIKALRKNGTIYFSTNYTKFEIDTENIHASEIKDITKATTSFDFEGKLKRWCYKIRQ